MKIFRCFNDLYIQTNESPKIYKLSRSINGKTYPGSGSTTEVPIGSTKEFCSLMATISMKSPHEGGLFEYIRSENMIHYDISTNPIRWQYRARIEI